MAEDSKYSDISSCTQVPHLTAIPIQPHPESHCPHTSLPVKNMNNTLPWTLSYSIQVKGSFSSNAIEVQV